MGDRKNLRRNFILVGAVLSGAYHVMNVMAKKRTEPEDIDAGNPYIEDGGDERQTGTIYEGRVKPALDKALSFGGLVILSPLYGLISLAVYLDDPGPVFFTQKRVGKDKHFFMLHKYRSMKMSTPHDVPTHMLENPEQYITRVGRFLRKSSLDELPQIWDIFRGQMSIIGPRPALWNQEDLVEERQKYGANSPKPGLTGLAQIRGRDELEIPDKAKIDGEYTTVLHKGGFNAFGQDVSCFIGTIESVMKHDGVMEGGTGAMSPAVSSDKFRTIRSAGMEPVNPADVGFEDYGYKKKFHIDKSIHKKVLITGIESYIGESFEKWAEHNYPNIETTAIDMTDGTWRDTDFSGFETVLHVAGVLYENTDKINEIEKEKYYKINTELAIETAQKAKDAGVKQFIFMSSISVYGEAAPYWKKKRIDEYSIVSPSDVYGDSKWQADKGIRKLADEEFKVAILRLPLVYGRGCKGIYPELVSLAKKLPYILDVENERSMIFIDNLCEFLCLLILSGEGGIYFPQNIEYVKTSLLLWEIGITTGHQMHRTKLFNPAVFVVSHIIGRGSKIADKVFGNYSYSQTISNYKGLDYQIYDLRESIIATEGRLSY